MNTESRERPEPVAVIRIVIVVGIAISIHVPDFVVIVRGYQNPTLFGNKAMPTTEAVRDTAKITKKYRELILVIYCGVWLMCYSVRSQLAICDLTFFCKITNPSASCGRR